LGTESNYHSCSGLGEALLPLYTLLSSVGVSRPSEMTVGVRYEPQHVAVVRVNVGVPTSPQPMRIHKPGSKKGSGLSFCYELG